MSFVYGGVDTDTLAGVKTRIKSWPSVGGLVLETVDKEGSGGRFYAGQYQTHTQFVHEVTILNDQPSDPRRDNFVGALDPARGPRDLILETDTLWKYPDVLLAGPIDWAPLRFIEGKGHMWRADIAMETVDQPYAVQVTPAVHAFTAASSYTLALGNTATYPTIEFPSGAQATVTIGSYSVVVGATPAGFTNVLDYQNFEFERRNGAGDKVASLVNLMSNYDRPLLPLGVATALSVVGAPAGTRRFYPNARRI